MRDEKNGLYSSKYSKDSGLSSPSSVLHKVTNNRKKRDVKNMEGGNVNNTNKSISSTISDKKISSAQMVNIIGNALLHFENKKDAQGGIQDTKLIVEEENSNSHSIGEEAFNFEDYCLMKSELEKYKAENADLNEKIKKQKAQTRISNNSQAFMKSTMEDIIAVFLLA